MMEDESNYSFKALLDKQPQSIATAIVAILNLMVITGTVHMSAEAVGASNVTLVALLSLFVRGKSVATGDVNDKVNAATKVAVAETKADIGAFLTNQAATSPPLPTYEPLSAPAGYEPLGPPTGAVESPKASAKAPAKSTASRPRKR